MGDKHHAEVTFASKCHRSAYPQKSAAIFVLIRSLLTLSITKDLVQRTIMQRCGLSNEATEQANEQKTNVKKQY